MKNSKPTSKGKQRILSITKELNSFLERLIKIKYITKGSIYTQKKKCGSKNCKCIRGELHSTKVLSLSHKGKTRLISLTKYPILELYRIEKQVKYYRQFRRYRAKIVQDFSLLMAEIKKLEQSILIEVPAKKGEKIEEKKRKG